MANTTATTLSSPLASPAAHSGGSDSTALNMILAFLAVIGIPILIYAFFFAIKCPPNPFEWYRRRSGKTAGELTNKIGHVELVSCVKYKEAASQKEHDSECPVCLGMFVDGEEIWQLNVCKHLFHVACIGMWLSSHSNCPVCRAFVSVNQSPKRPVIDGENDFRQGLPDSASLV